MDDERQGPRFGWLPDGSDDASYAFEDGGGEVVLALLAPVDDIDPAWLAQVRVPGLPLRVVVAYEAPPGALPYVPRTDHAGFDEAARAMVLLDRMACRLPAGDPSDVSSWTVVGPTELGDVLCRVAVGASRVVVSWPPRRGWSGLVLRARARSLVRRVARDLARPVHLITLGRVVVPG